MICSKTVFRCFKTLERLGDRLTGAAGPYFVAFATILMTTGTICFFEVIMPTLPFTLLTGPLCMLIAFNLLMHYYYVCSVPPGFVEDPPRDGGKSFMWAQPKNGKRGMPLTEGVRWSNESEYNITKALTTKCRKCAQTKPERTHHCRICNRCVLKYDHHCPVRVNQCVGLHNERHFVMFMGYLCLSTFCFCILGHRQMFDAIGLTFSDNWQYYVPVLAYILTYILSGVLCAAVGIMFCFHLWTIMHGETSVESQDHEIYSRIAKSRGEAFVNCYDLGKLRNLELFFNIGPNGYPIYTLFFPFRIQPYTDGRSWARRAGYEGHGGVRRGEELTDEEEEEP